MILTPALRTLNCFLFCGGQQGRGRVNCIFLPIEYMTVTTSFLLDGHECIDLCAQEHICSPFVMHSNLQLGVSKIFNSFTQQIALSCLSYYVGSSVWNGFQLWSKTETKPEKERERERDFLRNVKNV